MKTIEEKRLEGIRHRRAIESAFYRMIRDGELQWEQGIGGQWIAHSKRKD